MSISLIVLTAVAFISIDVEEAQGSTFDYITVPYQCKSGETVLRCDFGGSGCDISGQPLCKSEPGQN